MTPDEDFVHDNANPNSDGGTKIFDEMDKELLNAASSELVTSKAEEDYLRGYEEEETEEEKPEEKEGKIEKIVLGIGIAAMVIIIMIVVLLFGKAFHIFKKDDVTETEPSTEIATTLAEDEKSIVMPKVTGYLFEEAKKILEDQKITWYTYEYHSHDTVEEGYVFECSVEPGQTVKADTVVKLSVSSGKDHVFIPDSIIGQEQLAAVKALTKLGLKVNVEKEFSDEVMEGLVIRCKPGVGEQVPVGNEITVFIILSSFK